MNFFVLFLTIFGLEAGVSAIASERLTFKFQESFDEEKLSRFRRQINECYCCSTVQMEILVEQAEAHVIVFLLGLLLLLFLLGGLSVGQCELCYNKFPMKSQCVLSCIPPCSPPW